VARCDGADGNSSRFLKYIVRTRIFEFESHAPSSARAGSTLGDTYDEKLGEVFKAR
jgi:hypothetical protein